MAKQAQEQAQQFDFYKENDTDIIFWVDNVDVIGEHLFSFDKKKIYNLFADYPDRLTEQERKIFNNENPYWVDFYKERM